MRSFILVILVSCLTAMRSAAATGVEFFLFHGPSETVLGPFEFTTDARLGKTAKSWKIAVLDGDKFTLTDNAGTKFGPFVFADGAPLTIGNVPFTISTNCEGMLQMRADQKLWSQHPEQNPSVLAVLRGETLDNYKFIRAEPDSVIVGSSKGVSRIRLALLPDDIRQKYAFDPAKADAYSKEQAAVQAEADRKKIEDAVSKAQALDQLWSSLTPAVIEQPDYPEPHFPTQGFGKGGSSGQGGNSGQGSGGVHVRQNNNNNRGGSPQRITIGP